MKSIIEQIVSQVRSQVKGPHTSMAAKFVEILYSRVALDDLSSHTLEELVGIALSLWQLLQRRSLTELKIRVFNPELEKDHWASRRSVIQLIAQDRPFLVDSVLMALTRLGVTIHWTVHTGGMLVARDEHQNIIDLLPYHGEAKEGYWVEAPVYCEIDRQTDPAVLIEIETSLRKVLHDVDVVVEDWKFIKEKMQEAICELRSLSPHQNTEDVNESCAFLEWLLQNHFTFMGYRCYEIVGKGKDYALKLVPNSGLGVLRDYSRSKNIRYYADMPQKARELALSKDHVLIVSKTNTHSTVHRPAYTDYIGVKRFNEQGEFVGEHRFIGLYTSVAYASDPRFIPFLRHKVATIMKMSGLPERSHAGKELAHILATFPRDDLFQGTTEELFEIAMGIVYLQERRKIRLFVRRDAYGRFLSCLVYVPREKFNTGLILSIKNLLMKEFSGTDVSFDTHFSESVLARIHYVIRIDPSKDFNIDIKAVEAKIIEIARSWQDNFRDAVVEHFGEERGMSLFHRYFYAFSAGYQEAFSPSLAVLDIEHIEGLSDNDSLGMSLYPSTETAENLINFKLFRKDSTIPLSDALPMLENMGFRVISEQSYSLVFEDNREVWVNHFNVVYSKDPDIDVEKVKNVFQEAFEKIWFGVAENDVLNRLVLEAQLTWREITILRAYMKYFPQISVTFSQPYIAQTLVANPMVARLLVEFFDIGFNPARADSTGQVIEALRKRLDEALDQVQILDEDRILRRFADLMQATLRTNYFQQDTNRQSKPYLSFKIDSQKVPDMPRPYPKCEIWVYSPRFEGVHLRSALIARGGIRWSDRREDFRTEVLGLMKAQQVKNALIVPAGAKGGFYPKCLPINGDRESILQEGIDCYRQFISGLLDLVDNRVNNDIVTPDNTVCRDSEDCYLVVAADKGTATFSDIANQIALDRQYWLGDAFASGGCTGYDHKKIGITARGAWVSVKRHFQELGIDINKTEISVVGIGDMSGDVFGNGLLMSSRIRLVAAFNHMHIFLDPNPDPAISFKERQRMFDLPRSTWGDYNTKLISAGGGIHLRSSKSIRLTSEVKALLKTNHDSMAPNELIRHILMAPVDLLWNGGIGTYVKSSQETHADVGDRSNDNLRINGSEVQAKVVCEGGNLGFTQLGRIEYALNGGKINTDFIDNSAGVDCSDHEVNTKILLNTLVHSGELPEKKRNALLMNMTEEVAELVLRDNYEQNCAISLASFMVSNDLSLYIRFMDAIEAEGKIDRALEFLPDNKSLLERRSEGKTLTRPELAVLFSYSKNILKEIIKKTDLVVDPSLLSFCYRAFPKSLEKEYGKLMHHHYLVKEIVATQLTNQLVGDMGIAFVYQMQAETGAPIPAIIRAYFASASIFNMASIKAEIQALDYTVDAAVQYTMHAVLTRLVRRGTRWLLRARRQSIDIREVIGRFLNPIAELYQQLPELLLGEDRKNVLAREQALIDKKVPKRLAYRIASMSAVYPMLNVIEAAALRNADVFSVAKIYFNLVDRLNLLWFRDQINSYPVDNRWSVLARAAYKGDLDWIQRQLILSVLNLQASKDAFSAWLAGHASLIQRWDGVASELRNAESKDFAILFVAIRALLDLARDAIKEQ